MSAANDFEKAPPATSWKLLPRTVDGVKAKAEVRPGFVPDTYILIVSGKKNLLEHDRASVAYDIHPSA